MMYTSDVTVTKMVIISDMWLILRAFVMSGRLQHDNIYHRICGIFIDTDNWDYEDMREVTT